MVLRTRQRATTTVISGAFAPGHVTGLFRPSTRSRDPRGRGSVGAGIVLESGVWARATFTPGGPARRVVRGDSRRSLPISTEVARRLAGETPGRLVVELHHELPISQGFGMSSAGATATALAVGPIFRASRQRCWETAHLADLFGGGGLGGVSAIRGGGWERRVRPGVPPWGRVVHAPFRHSIFLAVLGRPLPSPRLLASARGLARLTRSAAAGVEELSRAPTAETLLDVSERFTDGAGLAPPGLRRVIDRLRTANAWAGQAMFGRSVWAVPRDSSARAGLVAALEQLGVRALELRAATHGARPDAPPPGQAF
ncbi:MAG: hypothetical protein L3K17_04360 [Thermoplasmata archaeon]|nr:hypothetical protein [Thermoplasmata archaeon]